jgi:hypothetical protein
MNQNPRGRHPLSVRIITDFTVLVQHEISKRRRGEKRQRIYLPNATLVIRQSESGDLTIEIEPP